MRRIVAGITIEDHEPFAPANRKHDEKDDGYRRKTEMEKEFVRLIVGGSAVIARNQNVDVRRNSRAAQEFELLDKLGRDVHRVGAGPLRNGNGDGGHAGQLAVLALGKMPRALFRGLPSTTIVATSRT